MAGIPAPLPHRVPCFVSRRLVCAARAIEHAQKLRRDLSTLYGPLARATARSSSRHLLLNCVRVPRASNATNCDFSAARLFHGLRTRAVQCSANHIRENSRFGEPLILGVTSVGLFESKESLVWLILLGN